MRRLWMRAGWVVLAGMVTTACGGDDDGMDPPPGTITWECPDGWVEAEGGGCGPAVVLCASGGGASAGACEGLDLSVPPPDGAPPFWLRPDGSIGGRWREPGEAGGPPGDESFATVPPEDWEPAAGIEECAPGWMLGGDGTCDPMLPATCPAGSEPIPGAECTATGDDACPADPTAFPDTTTWEGTVVHVRAGADPMVADGSAERPDPTITAGLARLGTSGSLAIAPGTYAERVLPAAGAGLRIGGACARRVIVDAPAEGPAVLAAAANVSLEGLTVTGGSEAGLRAEAAGWIVARGIVVDRTNVRGVVASGMGSRVELQDSVVRGTLPAAADGFGGRALQAEYGGAIDATRVAIVDNANAGAIALDGDSQILVSQTRIAGTAAGLDGGGAAALWADSGGAIDAYGVLVEDTIDTGIYVNAADSRIDFVGGTVRGTRPIEESGEYGRSVQVWNGSSAVLRNVLIEDGTEIGILAAGATVQVEGVHVRGIRPSPGTGHGEGILVQDGANLSGRAIRVADTREYGIFAYDTGSTISIEQVVIEDVLAATLGDCVGLRSSMGASVSADDVLVRRVEGLGLGAETGGDIDVHTVRIANVRSAGALVDGGGATVDLSDGRISDVAVDLRGIFGFGLFAQRGGTLTASHVWIERTHDSGIAVQEAGSMGTISDLMVVDVAVADDGFGGSGLYASAGGRLHAERVTVRQTTGTGVIASGLGELGTLLTVSDLSVQDVRLGTTRASRGIEAQQGARVEVTRAIVERTSEYGALAVGAGTSIVLRDVAVRDLAPDADGVAGRGLDALQGAELDVRGLLVQDVHELGVTVDGAGTQATLTDVMVSGVTPSARGFGCGAGVFDSARLSATRFAALDVHGAALLLTPRLEPGGGATVGDVFVRGIARSTIRPADVAMPQGREVAYGVYAGTGTTVGAERLRVEDGGYGMVAVGGAVTVTRGVITSQLDAAGAFAHEGSVQLTEVARFGNADDEVAENDMLVEASALPRPSEVCIEADSCEPAGM